MSTSLYSFIEVRKWVAGVARDHEVKLSGRKCKDVAYAWIQERELEHDGVAGDHSLHYADPTGNTAVERLLALMAPA